MVAAIYARKSVATEKGESIENQINLCEKFGKQSGIIKFLYYKDEGFSGKNTNRPKFKEMIQDAKSKKFTTLICYRLDRISRSVSDFSSTLELLQKYNINFISIKENFDTSCAIGRAMVYISSVFAQLERETIAERIKDNMLELSKTGRWLGGIPPLGFKSKPIDYKDSNGKNKRMYKLVQIPKEIKLVKLIFNLYLERKSFSFVSHYLCTYNYKGKNGGDFSQETVKQVIKNPIYTFADKKIYNYFKEKGALLCGNFNNSCGVITYNKRKKGKKLNPVNEWIVSTAEHKGIIKSNIWIKCQTINKLNYKRRPSRSATGNKFLLSGLLICGECGSSMSSWSRNNPKSGKYEKYYRCNLKTKASNRCCSKMLNAYKAEDLVLSSIKGVSSNELISVYAKLKSNKKNNNLIKLQQDKLKNQIQTNKKIIKSLILKLALLDDDPVVISEFKKEISNLNNEISDFKKQLTSLNNLDVNNLDMINNNLENFKKIFFLSNDVEKKRSYLLEIINYIVWDSKTSTLKINFL